MDEDQLSLAIGKRGQNARLTSRLLGWDVNIEKDESASEKFEQRVGQAAKVLADAIGIDEATALALVHAGMGTLDVLDYGGAAGFGGCRHRTGKGERDPGRGPERAAEELIFTPTLFMATRTTPAKPAIRRITGAAPKTGLAAKKPAERASRKRPSEKAPKPEVVSLIDEKVKPVRNRATEAEKKAQTGTGMRLKPITGTVAPAPAPTAAPEPLPAPAAVVSPEAAAEQQSAEEEAQALSDEKVIHIKPPIIIKDLAAQLGLRPFQIMKDLIEISIFASDQRNRLSRTSPQRSARSTASFSRKTNARRGAASTKWRSWSRRQRSRRSRKKTN